MAMSEQSGESSEHDQDPEQLRELADRLEAVAQLAEEIAEE